MASTFRRTRAPPAADSSSSSTASSSSTGSSSALLLLPGTRAWTAGTVLVSTGLRELDNLLAATTGKNTGGQPLGTCVYLEEDRLGTAAASCLVKYWCAEVSCLMVVAETLLCLLIIPYFLTVFYLHNTR